ncbi:MAG TPA: RiPP maturation radical SAM C-methyltransferase [Blastocatellia bacterium]|nr:RiPP maturation radical SAM C-methyltransferase [Blastocatellia bacterium]
MCIIRFVNMPFGSLQLPSIALTQLKSVVSQCDWPEVSVDVCYVNHDLAHYLGVDLYQDIAGSMKHSVSGLGDWFYRQLAFPWAEDNIDDYFARYYPHRGAEPAAFRRLIEEKRDGLEAFSLEVIDKYRLDEASIVGFTSMFIQNVPCFAMARMLKRLNPQVTIVMGGANCEWPMGLEIARNIDVVDYVFSGPALKSFPQLLQGILEADPEKCSKINGVFSRVQCAKVEQAAAAGVARISDGLPHVSQDVLGSTLDHPDWDANGPIKPIGDDMDMDAEIDLDYSSFLEALDYNFPNREVKPILLFETSRGCWWGEKAHCTFCGLNGATMNFRAMSPDQALKQFGRLFRYSDQCERYNCVDQIMAKNYLREVFPYLETPSNIHLFYEVKADLSEEELGVLSGARVKVIQPGVESLATSTLKLMKKGTTAFQNINLLKNCLIYDVCPEWNLLVGFPGEGEDVYAKYLNDLPLLAHLPPPHGVFPVRFDRFSPYFVQAKHYELDLHPLDYYELIYPLADDALANLAYYFADGNFRAKYMLTMAKWIGPVREKYGAWWGRWQDKQAHPALFMKRVDGKLIIHDSRFEDPQDYEIGDTTGLLLEYLNKPRRIPDITAFLASIAGSDPGREVELLRNHRLVFEEGDRLMNLVLPRELPSLTFSPH